MYPVLPPSVHEVLTRSGLHPVEADEPRPRPYAATGFADEPAFTDEADALAYQAAMDDAEDELVQQAIDSGVDPVHARLGITIDRKLADDALFIAQTEVARTLRDLASKFGPDAVRVALACAGYPVAA